VLTDRGFFGSQGQQESLLLKRHVEDTRRQKSTKSETIAFTTLESGALVEERVRQDISASHIDPQWGHEATRTTSPFSFGWNDFLINYFVVVTRGGERKERSYWSPASCGYWEPRSSEKLGGQHGGNGYNELVTV
jgi:hypothetical protein